MLRNVKATIVGKTLSAGDVSVKVVFVFICKLKGHKWQCNLS